MPGLEVSSSSAATALSPDIGDLQCLTDTNGVLISTMNDIPGYRVVHVLGAAYGLTVRSRNWTAGLGLVLKNMAGGELGWLAHLLYSARNDALTRLVKECQQRGGNAIVALRFDTGDLGRYAQVCAYGTACVVEKAEEPLLA